MTAPTKPPVPGELGGMDAYWASHPMADTPRGGVESSFDGSSMGTAPTGGLTPTYAGLGPVLEDPDSRVFQQVNDLVFRQDQIAQNRLAIDTHWTYVKLGYPWSTLEKQPGLDRYTQSLPYGQSAIRIQAVPNKSWDLINKTTQNLLQDFPHAEAQPVTGADEAQAAADMANRFLLQDAGEQGTNDPILFHDRVERALTCATSYIEVWTDPTGGGYVPLQIKAHPFAVDPSNPLFGPNGEPTPDYALRYVTSQGPNGEPAQFTTDPAAAAPQWQPALRASCWEREHVRVYPESQPVERAEKVIIIGYCTIGEAKRRWKAVAEMDPDDLSGLADWTPERYMALLPPFQRARWRLTDGKDKNKGGSSDERLIFYYHIFCKASPDYPKGADVVVSGMNGGLVLDRQLLAKPIEIKTSDNGGIPKTEIRCMEIPVVQITPRGDPDERDPTGRAYIELFAGAAENNAVLTQGFSQVIDQIIHLEKYIPVTSPVEGWQVRDSRRTGDAIPIMKSEDKPIYGATPPLPNEFFRLYEMSDEAINSIASSERAASGADNSKERSGKALQIAVGQNNISLSGMSNAVNGAYARFCRIKIEKCMADFSTQQQIGYVGEDGAYKQDEWSGVDFGLVGKVVIKTGTGTLMSPDSKVQYLGNLVASSLLGQDEAADAARPSFSDRLGLPPDPQMQRVARQVDAWENGPPAGWEQQAQVYQQAKSLADQQNAAATQEFQAAQLQDQADSQNAAAMGTPRDSQPLQPPTPVQPTDPMTGMPLQAPWTPFAVLPMDDEPQIAAMRQRFLRRLMATVEFEKQGPLWQNTVIEAYNTARQAVAAVQPQPALPKGVTIGVQADASSVGAAEQAIQHPSQAAPPVHPATAHQNTQAHTAPPKPQPPAAPQAPRPPL